jgi:signal transduction histidine kinase
MRRRCNGLLSTLAGVYALATVAVLPGPGAPVTTYATTAGAAALLTTAGIGLIAAGAATGWERPASPVGPLATVAGVAWLSPVWVGWTAGPPLIRNVAAVLTPFVLPALAHLIVSNRWLRAAGWVVAAGIALGLAALRDPLYDLRCWSDCAAGNVFLVTSDSTAARTLAGAWLWFSLAAGTLLTVWTAWTLVAAKPVQRRINWPVLVPAGAAVAAEAAFAGSLLWHAGALRAEPTEPAYPMLMVTYLARAGALTALAAGLGYAAWRQRRRRAAVTRLADDLGRSPGSLRAALVASLGDATLEVGYWLPATGQWVDATGQPLPPPAPDRAATTIQRDGQPVAIVRHDPSLVASTDLAAQLGAAARLAIDNERLRAETMAHLEEVRASRARIVVAGDAARRRLERDLHDGAQQRLLAVSYELRRAGVDGPEAAEVRTAMAELRELAHGIYPAILDTGLEPALRTLADTSTALVTLDGVPDERLPADVERAAYLVVAAAADQGDAVRVTVSRRPGWLTVEAAGARDDGYVALTDRIGALGGTVNHAAGVLRAEIPCA